MQELRVVVIAVVGAVLCQGAAVVDTIDVDVVDVLPESPKSQIKPLIDGITGRTFSDWGKSIMEWMGYDYDDYEDYDYQSVYYYAPSASAQAGYGLPLVGYESPSAGGQQSSYSSYAPVQVVHRPQYFQHPARDDSFDDDEWSFTDMMYNVAVTVIPVGLLLSALPTGLFTLAVRRRSLDDTNLLQDQFDPSELPLLNTLVENNFLSLTSRQCQEKLFCELSLLGEHEDASFLQKTFYYLATLTPDFVARKAGLARLFRTSRAGSCSMLRCSATPDQRPPPLASHQPPTDTNRISEAVTSPETETTETAKE
ncbi:uncharacterized protein LOC121858627 [Homarus americanus]|uniref:uncharacterized protein LOC121858627 n=1 Tax=Homarus americanus TaxID=6706 RepID=UPI001C4555D6|nr:uncharacterized protein LOC121858627 [Homarus americanus]